jgi:hypothetical protein
LGEQFSSGGFAHPEHLQGVEVADDLASLGAVADSRFDIAEGLGVGRHLDAGTAALVDQRNELIAHQLVELIGVQVDRQFVTALPDRQPWSMPCL